MKNNPTLKLRITGKTILFSLFILLFSCSANAYKESDLELAKAFESGKARMIEEDISDADLNLANADLSFADLHGIELSNVILDGANFSKSDLNFANFNGAKLPNAILASTDLSFAEFENADLTNADLSSNQGYLHIIGHEITEPGKHLIQEFNYLINTSTSSLPWVSKESCFIWLKHFKENIFDTLSFLNKSVLGTANKIAFPISLNFIDGNRIYTNFTRANAEGADFSYTYLIRALFENANLKNANFEGCMLSCANFDSADLTGANFKNACVRATGFKNVTGLSEEQKEDLYNRGAVVDDRDDDID